MLCDDSTLSNRLGLDTHSDWLNYYTELSDKVARNLSTFLICTMYIQAPIPRLLLNTKQIYCHLIKLYDIWTPKYFNGNVKNILVRKKEM